MEIDFYEKPGCVNGEKQKQILQQAGHSLNCINILSEQWTKEMLLPFVEGKAVVEIMNYTAPAIKNGVIDPASLSFDEAVSLMIEAPILIKRPLLKIADQYLQGFTDERLAPYLGDWTGEEDVTTCPNLQTLSCDEQRGPSK